MLCVLSLFFAEKKVTKKSRPKKSFSFFGMVLLCATVLLRCLANWLRWILLWFAAAMIWRFARFYLLFPDAAGSSTDRPCGESKYYQYFQKRTEKLPTHYLYEKASDITSNHTKACGCNFFISYCNCYLLCMDCWLSRSYTI